MPYNLIRDILENSLTTVTDLPDVAWENVAYKPTSGNAYVAPRFQPTSTRPSVRGINPQQRYQGLYRIHVYYPEDTGPQQIEVCASNILSTFGATKDLTFNGNTLRVEYSERSQVMQESPWVHLVVDVAWYYYD